MTAFLAARAAALFVTLSLAHTSFHAGQVVPAQLRNRSSSPVQVASCPTLARLTDDGWAAVTTSHGLDVACPQPNPVSATLRPGGETSVDVDLYDDLTPGAYRVTLPYRRATRRSATAPRANPNPGGTAVTGTFTVTGFDPGPAPHLPASRLRAIALKAARTDGDAHPSLIRYAEGTRFLATLVASDGTDAVDAWNWSYLIAIRGTFPPPRIKTPPGIPMGPGPVVHSATVEMLVVDARTGTVTDSLAADAFPQLSRLGPVMTIPSP